MDSDAATVERKYVLTKIAAGDWLLPSNDAQRIYRLRKYTDGPSFGLDPEISPRDFEVWRVSKWDQPIAMAGEISVDDEDRWEHVFDGARTRAEAIQAALSDA